MIKDEEIDLTEYRDFQIGQNDTIPLFIRRRDGIIQTNINNVAKAIIQKQLYGHFLWNVIPNYDKCYKYDGLVALGNKEQRKLTIETANWGTINNITCDCCGKEYIKIPWKKNWGLCKECDKINLHITIFPWEI